MQREEDEEVGERAETKDGFFEEEERHKEGATAAVVVSRIEERKRVRGDFFGLNEGVVVIAIIRIIRRLGEENEEEGEEAEQDPLIHWIS